MSHRTRNTRRAIESCTLQLHTWRPFQFPLTQNLIDSTSASKPYSNFNSFRTKRHCCADRGSSFSTEATTIDMSMSKLSLIDDDRSLSSVSKRCLFARKRRRRGSRSISGKSSDRSGNNRQRCCSVGASAAYGTCSDFPVAAATDSSGELFLNGDAANWSSDVSEAGRNNARKVERDNGHGEKDNLGSGLIGQNGNFDALGNESGYGSEPGYRGDAELGYGDEIDEEEDDPSLQFWEDEFGVHAVSHMERSGENTLQKAHHRGRRKKHDVRMLDVVR